MEIVYEWWREIDPKGMLEVHIDKVTDLLVRKTITQDADTAKKILGKYLDITNLKHGVIVSSEDFNQVFCKCIFKDALIDMTEDIKTLGEKVVDTPLTLKLGFYQR